MSDHVSQRVKSLAESATLAVSAKAAALKAEGVDVVSFGAGEPDFDTPAHIIQAAKDALDAGETRYAKPAHGIPKLKQAICEKLKRDNDLLYEPSQVIATIGGKDALYLAFQAVLDPGDEVVIPAPYWVSYPEQVRLAEGKSVFVTGDEANSFKLTPGEIEAVLTDRTKVVVLNYPSNPGGFCYTPDEVRALAEVLTQRDLLVFSDEMYEHLIYGDQKFISYGAVSPKAYEQTITFNAGSKTYAMTGWRTGFAAGPAPIIKGMAKIQSQDTSGVPTFCQHALAAALTGDQSCVQEMRKEFERRANHMYERLNAMPGVTCVRPTGAFYTFPNVSATYEKLGVKGSVEFATKALEEAHVALVPGAAFGCDQNVRLSFATSMKQIDKGLDRLAEFLG
ncbi:MAG: pyridoxal phosphate-dependent aminotransferase [Phycisphaerae bacterium]|nr:pyridoxal phosphate-dependent aminotransferase [Phycisphaerae bacterium]